MWKYFKRSHPGKRISLSIVVIIYKMSRAARNTLLSLSPSYQNGIKAGDYEVLIYENDSDDLLPAELISELPDNFRYTLIRAPSQSPVYALNRGLREARGELVGAMIDGARIVTPGLLRQALQASRTHDRSVITTMGWYLGVDAQNEAHRHGYSVEREEALLESIQWPDDGYRLFDVSVPDLSCTDGWVSPIRESAAIFMRQQQWKKLGGFNEGFTSRGGGIANLEMFRRACNAKGAHHVLLSDEATFHQSHGGVASQSTPDQLLENISQWEAEYRRVCGRAYAEPAQHDRILYGKVRDESVLHWRNALNEPFRARVDRTGAVRNLPVPSAQYPMRRAPIALETASLANTPEQQATQFVQMLFSEQRYEECRDCCRLLLKSWGHGKSLLVERLLMSCCNIWVDPALDSSARISRKLSALGHIYLILGCAKEAEEHLLRSLELDRTNNEARLAFTELKMTAGSVQEHLGSLHQMIRPRHYLEISVSGDSYVDLAASPTECVLIREEQPLRISCRSNTRIYPCSADRFFAQTSAYDRPTQAIDLALICGTHDHRAALRSFWHIERLSSPAATVAILGTRPLDQTSTKGDQHQPLSAGDVWKLIPHLQKMRPELKIATVDASPAGLTLIRGLKPNHPETLERFMNIDLELARAEHQQYLTNYQNAFTMLQHNSGELERFISAESMQCD